MNIRRWKIAALIITVLSAGAPVAHAQIVPLSLSKPLTVGWFMKSTETTNITPAADDKQFYVPASNGEVWCLATTDGHLLWKAEIGGQLTAPPLSDGRALYIASESEKDSEGKTGILRAVSGTTGITLWTRRIARPLQGALAQTQTHIYGGAADGQIYCINKIDGVNAWLVKDEGAFRSQPLVSNERLFIGGDSGSLLAMDINSGKTLWRYRTQSPVRSNIVMQNGRIFYGTTNGSIYAVDARTGRVRWQTRAGAGVQSLNASTRGLVVASYDNFVYHLSLKNGNKLWKRQLSGRITAQPVFADDGILLTPFAGDACVILDPKNGKQINLLEVGADNLTGATPVVSNRTLLVTTRNGFQAFVSPQPGK